MTDHIDGAGTTDRIGRLRDEAELAIAEARSTHALEEARVRYLGRRAELPNLLRHVADLPADQRAQVGRREEA